MNTFSLNFPSLDDTLRSLGGLPGSYVLLLLALLVCGAVGLYALQRKQLAAQRDKNQQKKTLNELRTLIQSQSSAMLLLSERIHTLEEYLELVGSRQQRLEQGKHSHLQSYQDAIKVANSGAGPEELVSRCGLSSSEADLISQLYGKAS